MKRETIVWAAEVMGSCAERRQLVRWADRLGIMAVSWSLESAILQTISIAVGYGLWVPFVPVSPSRVVAIFVGALATPALLGWFFRGGIAFRLSRTDVRRLDGRPAGRMRCAWRSVCAWFFSATMYAILGVLLVYNEPVVQEQTSQEDQMFVLALGLVFVSSMALHVPRRGLRNGSIRSVVSKICWRGLAWCHDEPFALGQYTPLLQLRGKSLV